MNEHTIMHIDDPASFKDWGDGLSTVKTRTEVLKKLVLQQTIDNRSLAAANYRVTADEMWDYLRRKAADMVEKSGRIIHGDVTISTQEDFIHDAVIFRMEMLTRENNEGTWGEVWRAIREDEEDRKYAKQYPINEYDDYDY